MEMMGHPSCQHLKEDSWCFQSRAPPPSYHKFQVAPPSYQEFQVAPQCYQKSPVTPQYYEDKSTPSCSPPPPYKATSSTSLSSRLLTILTLAILLLTSLTIALLWKHLELLAFLSTNLPPASTSLQPNHPTLPALSDDPPPLPKLPT